MRVNTFLVDIEATITLVIYRTYPIPASFGFLDFLPQHTSILTYFVHDSYNDFVSEACG
jgi:hypothetical protein